MALKVRRVSVAQLEHRVRKGLLVRMVYPLFLQSKRVALALFTPNPADRESVDRFQRQGA